MSRMLIAAFIGIVGASLVLFSAWLSHQTTSFSADATSNLIIAISFAFIHLLALVASLTYYQQHWSAKLACYGFLIGILLFSGSIIIKSVFAISLVAGVTPLGGIAYTLGWLSLAIALGKHHL
ncbi:DUF423 domain-containing protein [Thalassotalea ponticola]|uniref:DUF423 domain-containing protein n=1 Tax=Thalassotalea ponticola TaxID=1523392 RepID=UPI0025B623FF|nr:DUF423 domain-containing protein [Thalassotalea ponticola]MDN3651554.1 DUF423 domain-containing protein [Thalassotalea ponticola]